MSEDSKLRAASQKVLTWLECQGGHSVEVNSLTQELRAALGLPVAVKSAIEEYEEYLELHRAASLQGAIAAPMTLVKWSDLTTVSKIGFIEILLASINEGKLYDDIQRAQAFDKAAAAKEASDLKDAREAGGFGLW